MKPAAALDGAGTAGEETARRGARLAPTLLLVLPTLTVLVSVVLSTARGPFWLAYYDPEYVYLLSSLLLAEGEQAWYCDHPGATLEVLGAATMVATHIVAGQAPLRQDVMARPETYLAAIHGVVVAVLALTLVAMGLLVLRLTRSLMLALLLQLTPFLASTSLSVLSRTTPEPLLLTVSLLVGSAVLLSAVRPTSAATRWFAWSLGLICGLGLATKVTFLPLLLPAFLAVHLWRRRWLLLAVTAGSFLIVLYANVAEAGRFFTFMSAIAQHTDRYGNGPQGLMSLDTWLGHVAQLSSSLYRSEALFVLLVVGSIAAAAAATVVGGSGEHHRARVRVARALGGIALAQLALVVLVTKDPATPHHYLTPAFGLLGTNLVLLALLARTTFRRHGELLIRAAAALVIVAGLLFGRGSALRHRVHLDAGRIDRLACHRAALAAARTCRVAYAYASSSPEVAMRFGNGYTGDTLRFVPALEAVHPNGLFYNIWNHKFARFGGWVEPEEALREDTCIAVGRGFSSMIGSDLHLEPIHEGRSEVLYRATLALPAPASDP